jgi:hypothetical protein
LAYSSPPELPFLNTASRTAAATMLASRPRMIAEALAASRDRDVAVVTCEEGVVAPPVRIEIGDGILLVPPRVVAVLMLDVFSRWLAALLPPARPLVAGAAAGALLSRKTRWPLLKALSAAPRLISVVMLFRLSRSPPPSGPRLCETIVMPPMIPGIGAGTGVIVPEEIESSCTEVYSSLLLGVRLGVIFAAGFARKCLQPRGRF